MYPIILASSSPYRRRLLEQLGLSFEWSRPDIDETALPGETPQSLVKRLAQTKAQALAARYPRHWIIGSDQVACLDGRTLGKPGNVDNAQRQLRACSGRRVEFLTGLCLSNSDGSFCETIVEPFIVEFRALTDAQIDRYLAREQPFDCAGSFKPRGSALPCSSACWGTTPTR